MYREIGDVFTMVDSDTSKVVELQVVKERYGLVCEECYFYKEYEPAGHGASAARSAGCPHPGGP